MEPVYGIHLGLVVSGGQDPENRNRIQVWVPHISTTVYSSLNSKVQTTEFVDPAIKGPQDLFKIDQNLLSKLQQILPWAECGAPFFGGSSGLFNTATRTTANTTGSTIAGTTTGQKGFPQTTMNQTLTSNKPADVKLGQNPQIYTGAQLGFDCSRNTGNTIGTTQSYCDMQWISVADAHAINLQAAQSAGVPNPEQYANLMDALQSKESAVVNGYVALNEKFQEYDANGNPTEISQGLFSLSTSNTVYGINEENILDPTAQAQAAVKILQSNNGSSYWSTWNDANQAAGTGAVFANTVSSPPFNPNATGLCTTRFTDIASKKGMVPFNIGIPGSAVGTFSTPVPGSKVFVFFMGGDVQKPVYFAQAINPSDIKAITG